MNHIQYYDRHPPVNVFSFVLKKKKCIFSLFQMQQQVVIVGNGAVGKSSMIQRFCKGVFTRDYKKTIGVDFLERIIEYEQFKHTQKIKEK